jgi:hypothetical protein
MDYEPLIIWEKWQDPFGEKNDDVPDYDSYDEEELVDKTVVSKVLLTPMGMIPYNDNTASSKIFNFWLGHTNFSITQPISDLIEDTHGVETLDIFTRYRFRIAIGKAFDDSEIMRNINTSIYSLFNENHDE